MTDEQQKKIFSKNLRYYVHISGKQQKEIAEILGVNQKTFNGWCTGLSMPKAGKRAQNTTTKRRYENEKNNRSGKRSSSAWI